MNDSSSKSRRAHNELLLKLVAYLREAFVIKGDVSYREIAEALSETGTESLRRVIDRKFVEPGLLKKEKRGREVSYVLSKGAEKAMAKIAANLLLSDKPREICPAARRAKALLDDLLPDEIGNELSANERERMIQEVGELIVDHLPKEPPFPKSHVNGDYGRDLEFHNDMLAGRLALEEVIQDLYRHDTNSYIRHLEVGLSKLLKVRSAASQIDARNVVLNCEKQGSNTIFRIQRFVSQSSYLRTNIDNLNNDLSKLLSHLSSNASSTSSFCIDMWKHCLMPGQSFDEPIIENL